MHYIIGTTFNVDIRSSGATDNQSLLMRRYRQYFPENGRYEIWYIRPTKTGTVEYTFMNSNNRRTTSVEFANAREADKIIAVFTGEDVPDYDQRYKDEIMNAADQ